ncbi:MAG: iron ABC transporter substrate-binding protein [Spirochaetaceae bacterium]|nr:MAG: iron ABC transporter substrate-binding protein [Spirochaetaceae bacterium]
MLRKHYQNQFLLWRAACLGAALLSITALLWAAPAQEHPAAYGESAVHTRTITDMAGREVTIPATVDRVICSGSGALRLLTYLQAHDKIVAVDSAEMGTPVDVRPYAIANPQFKDYPVFGDFRGMDNPERILGLEVQPQVILKIEGGYDYEQLAARTGIPVVVIGYGDLNTDRATLDATLRLMAEVVGAEARAEELITYFNSLIEDLRERGAASSSSKPSTFVGGIAARGAHGFTATERNFTPFALLGARNVAARTAANGSSSTEASSSHATIAREQLLEWDPDYIFLDLATTRGGGGGLEQLRDDPIYRGMSAVQNDRVFGLLPYNSYTRNFDTVLANSYYIGTVLYPEAFSDIDPHAKADEIYTFLNGAAAMAELRAMFPGKVFAPLSVR